MVDFSEPRFTSGILTVRQVSELVGMPLDTAKAWAGQRANRRPFITRVPTLRRGWPSIPLIGLAEAATLRGLRTALPSKEVRLIADWARQQDDYALATNRVVTDGVNAFIDEYPDREVDDGRNVWRLRDRQQAIIEAVEDTLRPVLFDSSGYAEAFKVESLPDVTIRATINAGRMSFSRTGTPVFAVAQMLEDGESSRSVAEAFGLTAGEVESVREQASMVRTAA